MKASRPGAEKDRFRPTLLHASTFGGVSQCRGVYGASRDWFLDLFGFREVSYEDTQKRLQIQPLAEGTVDGGWVLEGENGASYKVGRFSTPSLGELEDEANRLGGTARLRGKLRVFNIRGDVAMKHNTPANRHATFQVASQFNCLEFLGPEMVPEHGVTMYCRDRTQGPACCLACGPATAFRNYFAEVGGRRGQRAHRQINNLEPLLAALPGGPAGHVRVQGGYTLAEDEGLRRLNGRLQLLGGSARSALRRELRVGVHEDVQVTSSDWGERPARDDEQTVTQVFGSACSVSYSGNGLALWEPLASLVLSASYEATLWAALLSALRHGGEEGSRRVFLTCLGGGVFGNDLRWIVDAMDEAFDKFRDVALEVYIVTYAGPIERQLQDLER